jgi:hypothetical protein
MAASLDLALTAREREGSSITALHFVRPSHDFSPVCKIFNSVEFL